MMSRRARSLHASAIALCWVVAALLVVLVVAGFRAALAAEPITCAFAPPILDSFQAVGPQSTYDHRAHNRVLCALNRLQAREAASGAAETVCAPVTVAAGARQLVNVGLVAPTTGTEPVSGSVIDPTNPARLQLDGIQGVSGTTGTVWVFNRDGTNQRTGTVCLAVLRP